MRIKSVTLRHYRLHRSLTIDFDPSRTLVGGPNESGKSTVVEAIHRALFFKAKGNTEHHRAMAASSGNAEVDLSFEADGSDYLLKKRFGPSGSTSLSSSSGMLTAEAAESELARLLGVEAGLNSSKAALQWSHLWVTQGQSGTDPTTHATQHRDGLLQRLQTMGGAAALQSDADAEAAAYFADLVDRLFTQARRPKAGSELERAESIAAATAEELTTAEERLRRQESTVRDFENATRSLRAAGESLATLEKERQEIEAKVQRLAELRQLEAEHAHTARSAAERLKALVTADRQVIKTRAELDELARQLAPLSEARAQADADHEAARKRTADAEQAYRSADDAVRAARLRRELAGAFVQLFERQEAHGKLCERHAKVTRSQGDLTQLQEQLARLPVVEKSTLTKLQKQEAAISTAQAALHAMAAGLEVLTTDQPIKAGEHLIQVGEKQILTEDTELTIGSSIRLRIQPGGGTNLADARKSLADAKQVLQQSLDGAGLHSVDEAVEFAGRRDELRARIKTLQAELEALGASQIVEELSSASNDVAAASATVERLGALVSDHESPKDKATARALAQSLEGQLKAAEEGASQAKATRDRSMAQLESTEALSKTKRAECDQRHTQLTGLKAQLELLLRTHGDDDARTRELVERQSATRTADAALKSTADAITALQPDLLERDRDRINRSLHAQTESRNAAHTAIAVAQAALFSDGREDPQSTVATARAKAGSAEEYRDAVRTKSNAIALLDQLFREEQRALADQFTQPFADKISGYLQCIFGAGAKAQVSLENNEFGGLQLVRTDSGGTFGFDVLSGGAREQTAAAVRLAMAEVLAASHGGCLPIVFDDAFAYSDPVRVQQLQRMLDLAATRGLQVIVLTCNPADYSGLGARLFSMPPPGSTQ